MIAKSVSLHVAAVYDCEECGRETFIRLATNEQVAMENKHRYNTVVVIPREVTCPHCKTTFKAFDEAFGEEVD